MDPSTTGSVSGVVRFRDTPPQRNAIQMDQDPYCAALHCTGSVKTEGGAVDATGTLPNVFVYIKTGAEGYDLPRPEGFVTLDERGCMCQQQVLGVRVGQTLRIVSSDATTHTVDAEGRQNGEWRKARLPGAPQINKVFTHAEVMIPAKCKVRPWMTACVGVVANPFFEVTGSDRNYSLKGLPPDCYTVEAWTATFGSEEQEVTIEPRSSATLNFEFTVTGASLRLAARASD
jgi:hypothetical protein